MRGALHFRRALIGHQRRDERIGLVAELSRQLLNALPCLGRDAWMVAQRKGNCSLAEARLVGDVLEADRLRRVHLTCSVTAPLSKDKMSAIDHCE